MFQDLTYLAIGIRIRTFNIPIDIALIIIIYRYLDGLFCVGRVRIYVYGVHVYICIRMQRHIYIYIINTLAAYTACYSYKDFRINIVRNFFTTLYIYSIASCMQQWLIMI